MFSNASLPPRELLHQQSIHSLLGALMTINVHDDQSNRDDKNLNKSDAFLVGSPEEENQFIDLRVTRGKMLE
jgi:hypothetical protein